MNLDDFKRKLFDLKDPFEQQNLFYELAYNSMKIFESMRIPVHSRSLFHPYFTKMKPIQHKDSMDQYVYVSQCSICQSYLINEGTRDYHGYIDSSIHKRALKFGSENGYSIPVAIYGMEIDDFCLVNYCDNVKEYIYEFSYYDICFFFNNSDAICEYLCNIALKETPDHSLLKKMKFFNNCNYESIVVNEKMEFHLFNYLFNLKKDSLKNSLLNEKIINSDKIKKCFCVSSCICKLCFLNLIYENYDIMTNTSSNSDENEKELNNLFFENIDRFYMMKNRDCFIKSNSNFSEAMLNITRRIGMSDDENVFGYLKPSLYNYTYMPENIKRNAINNVLSYMLPFEKNNMERTIRKISKLNKTQIFDKVYFKK